MNKTTITPELLRNALSFVPSNLPRDEWARVGMAIKSEYPDETGLQLFSEWSAASGGTFDAAAVRSTWRSIKAGGGGCVNAAVSGQATWLQTDPHG